MYEISVIIAVYNKTNKNEFKEAISSVINQTYLPQEIIVVYDGNGCDDLIEVTQYFKLNCNQILFNEVFLNKNSGPGVARNHGVKIANYNLIAIMDSDDYSYNNRFELQINEFKKGEADLVGGQIDEYNENLDLFLQTRLVPEKYIDIKKNLKYNTTINNVTIIIKKEVFMKIGGYDSINFGEDYIMWAKFIDNGFIATNLSTSLVKVRTGYSFLNRRYSINNLTNNIKLSIRLSKYKSVGIYYSFFRLLKFILFMILPISLKKHIFKKIIRKNA